MVNWQLQSVAVMLHDNFPGEELHAVLRWLSVMEEGSEKDIFVNKNLEQDLELAIACCDTFACGRLFQLACDRLLASKRSRGLPSYAA